MHLLFFMNRNGYQLLKNGGRKMMVKGEILNFGTK